MRLLFLILLAVVSIGCNTGLEPPSPDPGIGGVVRFAPGSWPVQDSLQGLWVFASRQYPLDSARVVEGVLVEPRFIYLYPSLSESLPMYVDMVQFNFALEPGVYPYIGVIQQLRTELLVSNFRVVSVLAVPGTDTLPRSIVVHDGEFISGLDLNVDFHNPPPQPFQ